MTAIRTKDKLFLAVVVPAAALAAYVWLWRLDAGKRVQAFEQRCDALVAPADFPFERRRAEQALREAEAAREAVRRAPAPSVKVKGDPAAGTAARERAVLAAFRKAGLRVVRSAPAEEGPSVAALRATGVCPQPVTRTYALEGTFPQVQAALDGFRDREASVVVERLAFSDARPRWLLTVSE